MIHPDLDELQKTYRALASVILADPDARISGRTILNGKSVGEMISDMATHLHNVGAEIILQREDKARLDWLDGRDRVMWTAGEKDPMDMRILPLRESLDAARKK